MFYIFLFQIKSNNIYKMGWATVASSQTAPPSLMGNDHFIKTVEWEMLDKSKFFPMSCASSFTVRCFLYPLTLIRTRYAIVLIADCNYLHSKVSWEDSKWDWKYFQWDLRRMKEHAPGVQNVFAISAGRFFVL